MSFKKMLSLGLAALLTLSCAATAFAAQDANQDPANTEVTDETLVIGLASEPSALWGGGSGKVENEMQIIGNALMDTLVVVDRNTYEVKPNVATAWEWVDGTHCKFTLRDDVKMNDGNMLTADDVVYDVNTWIEYCANSDTGRFLVGAEANDEHTVTIEFTSSAPDNIYLIAWSNFGVFNESGIEAAGGIEAAAKNPIMGSGKYKFKEWVSGQSITIERNDEYWNPDYKGYFKEIKFTFTNDAAARAMAVQSGDAQVAYDMPISMASTYEGNDAVNLIAHTFGQNTRLWYNMGPKAGATADIKVRQAIDKALDFNAIALVGTANMGTEVHGYFPDNSRFYNETFTAEERAVDIEGAKALLAEAGYADGLDLTIVGMQDQNPIFVVMQENLRQVGINLNISILDTASFVGCAAGGDYDLIHVGDLCDARYPAIMTFFFQSNIDTFCIGGPKWTTPEIESAILEFIAEPDEAKAKEELAAIENNFKENMVYSNTYGEMHASLTAKDIKGYTTIERGFLDCTNFYK